MNGLMKFDPFSELQALQKQFFGDDWLTNIQGVQLPTTDIYTDEKQLTLEAHLPNFEEDDVNIHVLDDGTLEVQAERHEKEEDKKKKYVLRESSSSFYRRIRLPKNADQGNIDAHMKNGVLKVVIPFKELPKPKKISIKKS
ncbi:Hsp20/alpha crystallin family protein [Candidatus Saccharibacteria bacterium]|nr:Hsp20/alpha crystallin family protein [Candidatus Saccharibacteria bacterium]